MEIARSSWLNAIASSIFLLPHQFRLFFARDMCWLGELPGAGNKSAEHYGISLFGGNGRQRFDPVDALLEIQVSRWSRRRDRSSITGLMRFPAVMITALRGMPTELHAGVYPLLGLSPATLTRSEIPKMLKNSLAIHPPIFCNSNFFEF